MLLERGLLYEVRVSASTAYSNRNVNSPYSEKALVQIDPFNAPAQVSVYERDLFVYEITWQFPVDSEPQIDPHSVFYEVWYQATRGGRNSVLHKHVETNMTSLLVEPILNVPIGYMYTFFLRFCLLQTLREPYEVSFQQIVCSAYSQPVTIDMVSHRFKILLTSLTTTCLDVAIMYILDTINH